MELLVPDRNSRSHENSLYVPKIQEGKEAKLVFVPATSTGLCSWTRFLRGTLAGRQEDSDTWLEAAAAVQHLHAGFFFVRA